MTRIQRIQQQLQAEFAPSQLEVVDESAAHQGHAGWRAEGETHIQVRIAAAKLRGMPRLAAHRAIHAVLADEFAGGLHALSIVLL